MRENDGRPTRGGRLHSNRGGGSVLRARRLRRGLAAFCVVSLAAGCTAGSPSPPSTTGRSGAGPSSPAVSCAVRTLASLTERRRIGQLFMVGLANGTLSPATAAAIRRRHFGSVTFVTIVTGGVAAVRDVTAGVQALATQKATGGVGFFVAANQEGGEVQALQGPGFSRMPSALAQGAMAPAALRRLAGEWGRELAAAGINVDLAPVLDTVPPGVGARNLPIGSLHREYGHDPGTVASHALAFIEGMAGAGVDTVGKHFPGLGRVRGNTDYAADVVDRTTTAEDPYLTPFARAVAAGVPFVMVALATYPRIDPAHLAVFSPTVVGGVLRGRLHFGGVVMSDDLGAAVAVAGVPVGQRGVDFILAGGDMIVSQTVSAAVAMARAIAARAAADPSFRAEVDAAALRVLEAKQAAGLLPCGD